MLDSIEKENWLHSDFEQHRLDPQRQFYIVIKAWYEQRNAALHETSKPKRALTEIGSMDFGLDSQQIERLRMRYSSKAERMKRANLKDSDQLMEELNSKPKLLVVDQPQKVA